MDSASLLTTVVRLLIFILLSAAIVAFVLLMLRNHGFKLVIKNKFIMITLTASTFMWLDIIFNVIYRDFYPDERLAIDLSFYFSNVTRIGHYLLVYLRSKALLDLSRFRTAIYALAAFLSLTAVLILAGLSDTLLTQRTWGLVLLVLILMTVLILIDVATTIAFARHVYVVSGDSLAVNVNSIQTMLIAKRGMCTCFCFFLNMIATIVSLYNSPGICHLFVELFSGIGMAVWMLMKIELDQVKVNTTIAQGKT
eukprot:TRINITY_DN38413_c0_g1_i1.p1 TRINITY_DN38413_c0_g1~~TRINITY_DN38413_c0_g1_i1.p1  ORF type:complete len:253 (-),score=50.72 TRINITY_DN38413_c0_g1_i1:109-867(-)